MKQLWSLVLCLCIFGWSQVASAGTPNSKELVYVQRLNLVGKLAGGVQKALDETKSPAASSFAYAVEVIDFQIDKLRGWKVPAAEVRPVRDQLLRFMTAQRELYRASSKGEYKRIKGLAEDFKKEFIGLQEAWKRLFPRYQR